MGADNSFYVKSIASYAPIFFGYIIQVLAIVTRLLPGDYDNFFQTFQGFAFFSIEISWIVKLQSQVTFF